MLNYLGMQEREKAIYFTGLNGIRAIAALSVLLGHVNGALQNFGVQKYSLYLWGGKAEQLSYYLGSHGVTMFFVLSGFLITFLLLKEKDKTKTINIKSFYIRRALRIWPLYFFYLGISLLVIFFFSENLPSFSTIFLYIFFLANIPFVGGFAPQILSHLWSIAVEEQFYLFWPHIFKYKQKLVTILIGLILFQWFFRLISKIYFPTYPISFLSQVNRFDCMMMGGLLAIMIYKKSNFLKVITNKYIQLGAWFLLIAMKFDSKVYINALVEFWMITVITCIIIAEQVVSKRKIINLENKWLNFFGVLSFGIYVYHPLIIYLSEKTLINIDFNSELLKTVFVFFAVFGLTTIVSWLSYHYLEVRFLKLKNKFQIVKSSGGKD